MALRGTYKGREVRDDGMYLTVFGEASILADHKLKVVVAGHPKDFMRVTVEPNDDFDESLYFCKVYLAPLDELREEDGSRNVFLLDYGEKDHSPDGKGPSCRVRAVAADILKAYNFDLWNKWYVLRCEAFQPMQRAVFDGVEIIASMDEYTVPAFSENYDIDMIKRDFEIINKKFQKKGLPQRRNLFLINPRRLA